MVFDLGVIGVVECTHTNCGCTSPCTTTTMLWSGKEKREREKGLEEEGKNKEKGVVFVGDFAACEGDTSVMLMIRLGEKGA